MPLENKVGIVIVTYNVSNLLLLQIQCIRKYCKDQNYEIIIIDNSTLPSEIDSISYHSKNQGCRYIKTNSSALNGTESHVFAANLSYLKLKNEFNYFLYLDHDNFPINDFSVSNILQEKVIAGLGQGQLKKYFWPGCVMWNNDKVNNDLIDFSYNYEYKLDTGGNFYKVIEQCGEENCIFFNEEYCQNKYFNETKYNHYSVINNGMFMHFINGSNWNSVEKNNERINGLINILKERTEIE